MLLGSIAHFESLQSNVLFCVTCAGKQGDLAS